MGSGLNVFVAKTGETEDNEDEARLTSSQKGSRRKLFTTPALEASQRHHNEPAPTENSSSYGVGVNRQSD
jgi:hypothetical protein